MAIQDKFDGGSFLSVLGGRKLEEACIAMVDRHDDPQAWISAYFAAVTGQSGSPVLSKSKDRLLLTLLPLTTISPPWIGPFMASEKKVNSIAPC